MKTKKQYSDSMTNFIIGVMGIIVTLIMVLTLNSDSQYKKQNQDIEIELLDEMEIPLDTINKDSKDWTGTTQ